MVQVALTMDIVFHIAQMAWKIAMANALKRRTPEVSRKDNVNLMRRNIMGFAIIVLTDLKKAVTNVILHAQTTCPMNAVTIA